MTLALFVIAQAGEQGFLELVKSVGLAGALLAVILIWATKSFIPSLQKDATAARREFLAALDRVEERHERSIDKVVGAFERERKDNLEQHREFDSRIDELERDTDRKEKR